MSEIVKCANPKCDNQFLQLVEPPLCRHCEKEQKEASRMTTYKIGDKVWFQVHNPGTGAKKAVVEKVYTEWYPGEFGIDKWAYVVRYESSGVAGNVRDRHLRKRA